MSHTLAIKPGGGRVSKFVSPSSAPANALNAPIPLLTALKATITRITEGLLAGRSLSYKFLWREVTA
jgi:hypothetical protein